MAAELIHIKSIAMPVVSMAGGIAVNVIANAKPKFWTDRRPFTVAGALSVAGMVYVFSHLLFKGTTVDDTQHTTLMLLLVGYFMMMLIVASFIRACRQEEHSSTFINVVREVFAPNFLMGLILYTIVFFIQKNV